MSEIWNSWDLKPPPICTVKTKLHFKEIKDLRQITYDAIKTLGNGNVLDREAAILSRFLYKSKRLFRHDKGMKTLMKVNQCLKRYLKLNLHGALSSFMESLPYKFSETATYAYLPTKGMLKWILLSLQAFSQLFVRVIKLSKEIGLYMYQKMSLGWSLNHSLLIFSLTARILVTSKFLVTKSIEWYSCFYKCLPFLDESAKFLPDYTFPTDLKKWLGPVDLMPLKKKTAIDEIFQVIDLEKEDEDEDDDEEVKIVNEKFFKSVFNTILDIDSDIEEVTVVEAEETEKEKEKEKGVKRSFRSLMDEEDMGVAVNEEEEEESSNIVKKKRKRKRKNNSNNVS